MSETYGGASEPQGDPVSSDGQTPEVNPKSADELLGEPELEDAGKRALTAERRARAAAEKEAKTLKARLDELEAEKLSKEEKAAKEAADAKSEAEAAKREALRWRIAARHGISDEDAELFLTGSDEESLTRQAERLIELQPKAGKGGVPVPGVGSRPEKPPTIAEQIRAAEQAGDAARVMALKTQQLAELARNNQ